MATHVSLLPQWIPLKILACVEQCSFAHLVNKSFCLCFVLYGSTFLAALKKVLGTLFACKPALQRMLSIFKSYQCFFPDSIL